MSAARIVSFSQAGEDVVLRRALPGPLGFYVDLGAGLPSLDSVTKIFYDAGWAGINVEPQQDLLAALAWARPGDTNLGCAVGERPGPATLNIIPAKWGWASVEPNVTASHVAGGKEILPVPVVVQNLNTILDAHVPNGTIIDFIKIDVEGAEAQVLRSFDLTMWRPRVLVIEATEPDSSEPAHETWEPIILNQDYQLALFDGLNRFYARRDDPKLLRVLSTPANIFDRFIPDRWWHLVPATQRRQLIQEWASDGEDVSALEDYEKQHPVLLMEREAACRRDAGGSLAFPPG